MDYTGTILSLLKGDTRSLDYGLYELQSIFRTYLNDMGPFLGTILNYKKDLYVHC